ncbi:hypothetical protein KKC88_01765 [Patescibacteria group bacterium]|nr:hypothetical protein [Patescibacteria group bacterium]MBU1673848.1 hypothetical protein [Patescibacteria group bacterium]MBU1963225.1 hypothetical protein [Patescibacteria group bacterium]
MKKSILVLGLFVAVGLILFQPLQSKAGELSKAYRSMQAVYTKIKVQQLNVQGKIWNKVGSVKIKDKLNVEKRARFNTNIDVRGGIKNNGDGTVRVYDNLKVDKYAEIVEELRLGHIDFSVTDIASIDTSTLSGGDIFLSSADFKLYLWDGTAWIDLTQQNTDTTYTNGSGLNLAGTEFSVNENWAPTWTNHHDFNDSLSVGIAGVTTSTAVAQINHVMQLTSTGTPFPCTSPSDAGTMFINSTTGDLCVCNPPFGPAWMVAGSVGLGTPTPCP